MGVFSGPDIRENGLILALDASNNKSYNSRENLVSYSTYNASTWSKIETTGTGTLTTGIDAPDGSTNAIRITFNNNGNILLRVTFPAFTPNGTDTYTTSFYVRKISGTGNVSTDLSDGNPGGDYSSRLITNQWVRITTSAVPTATSKSFIDLISDTNTNYVLDFWGLQVEKSTSVTNYTATNGSTISRATTFTDLSGNGNNGTLTNGPSYDGFNSGSILFDGSNDFIDLTNKSVAISGNGARSIFCWVKSTTGGRCIISTGTANNSQAFNLVTYGSSKVGVMGYNYDFYPTTGANVFDGNWHFVGATYDGAGTLITYVDGVQDNISTGRTYSTTGQNNFIGKSHHTGSDAYWNGNIAQTQIHNRALTASEIQQNFNANRGRFGI